MALAWDEIAKKAETILIVHHWDADGICSAAIISDYLYSLGNKKIKYAVPEIGTFRLIPDKAGFPLKKGNINIPDENYELAFVLDYSVPSNDIIVFREHYDIPVVVYDHHIRDPIEDDNIFYYNPVALGEPGKSWPSCTWVITKSAGFDISDMSVMGIAGDIESRFLETGFDIFPEIAEYLDSDKHKYMEFVRAKDLLDIHYKENDTAMLKRIAEYVRGIQGSPNRILEQKEWMEKQTAHDNELKELTDSDPGEIISGKLAVYRIDSRRNIISALTRRLAAKTEFDYVLVENSGFFADRVQMYVRSSYNKKGLSTEFFKKCARDLDAEVGGKDEVAGIILSRDKRGDFFRSVKENING